MLKQALQVNAQSTLISFNLPDLPSDCKQAITGIWTSPDDGQTISSCNSDCFHYASKESISFIMDRRKNVSGDMLLNYKIESQTNYSIIQIDFLYITDGDVKINAHINSQLIFSFADLKYSIYTDIYTDLWCKNTQLIQKASLSFYKSDAKILDNNLIIHFEKITNDMNNYYLFGIKAIQISMTCSITCKVCLNESNCDICKYSFKKITLPSGLVVCEQITNCSQNCFLCAVSQTENICTQCLPGYLLQGNKCTSLDKNNICKSQPNTYYVDSNKCVKYTQNAFQYVNGQYQRTNMETYYSYKCPNNQVVILYPESYYSLYTCGCYTNNCSSCPYGICTACSEGYNLYNIDCVPNCKSNQYFDLLTLKCIDCGNNCDICNSQTCQQCTDSTFQVDLRNPQNCILCHINNCFQCSDNNKCSVCMDNYQLSADYSSCNIPCQVNNCITCNDNSSTSCLQCAQSYTLNTNNQQCVKCNQDQIMLDDFSCISINSCIINNCQSCKAQNPLSCDVCLPNYYLNLDSNQCFSCFVQNCLQCSNRNYQECQTCSENYSLSSDRSQCLQCQIQNCQKCDPQNNLICQTCQDNQYLNANQTQCLPCSVQNCQECHSKNYQLCQKCISGYQANNDSKSCEQILQETRNYFHLEQTLIKNGYNVNIIFDNPLAQESVNSLQYSKIDSNKYALQFNLTSNKLLNLQISPACNIKSSYLIVTISNSTFAHQNSVKDISQKLKLQPFVLMSQSNIEASQQLTQYGSMFVTSSLLSIIPAIFFGNIYIICNTLDITGFLYYLMFLDIRYPLNIMNFYELFKNFNFPFIPNFFLYIIDPNYVQESPPQFMVQETDNYYLKNFGQYFTIYLAGFLLYFLAKILAKSPIKYLNSYCQRAIKETWEFSAMIDLCWSFYIYLVVAVLIQFNMYNFDDVNSCFLNYMLHSISTVIILGIPFLFFVIIQKKKNEINDKEFIQKYSSLLSGLKVTLDQVQSQNKESSQYDISIKSDDKNLNGSVCSLGTKLKISDQQNNRIRRKKLKTNSIIVSDMNTSPIQLTTSLSKIEEKQQLSGRKKLIYRLSRYYNVLLYFRKILFCIIITYLYNNPYHQLVLISILNFLIIAFIVIIIPFQSSYFNYQFMLQELSLIIIQALASLLINDGQNVSEDYRMNVGWIIIGISSFWIIYYTLLIFKDLIIEIYKLFKYLIQTVAKKYFVSQICKVKQIKCESGSNNLIKNNEESQMTITTHKYPFTSRNPTKYSLQTNQLSTQKPLQQQNNLNTYIKDNNLIKNYM
ncbi:hypothetical protein ABPG74_002104 [Tetrahymena malaccensis]